MNLGFVKIATFSPQIKVADVDFNKNSIKNGIDNAIKEGAHVLALPELCLTGSTLGDLFYSKSLLESARKALIDIALYTQGKNIIVFVGLPILKDGKIYNVYAGINNGVVLGMVAKSNNKETVFADAEDFISCVDLGDCQMENDAITFGKNIIFSHSEKQNFKICVDFFDQVGTLNCPSHYLVQAGATIVICPSASAEFSGQSKEREQLIMAHSKLTNSICVMVNAGEGESTTDCVCSGHAIIAENGRIIAQTQPFENRLNCCVVDLDYIDFERSKAFKFYEQIKQRNHFLVGFDININECDINRVYDKTPFIINGEEQFLIDIAANGLKKRIMHVNASKIVIGVSGGLDSTLALIVASRTMQLLQRPQKDIIAVTMPCFGTSSRTFDNSVTLAKAFGVTLKKVDIAKAVKRHLKDLKHEETVHDAAYENAQARERTQVLMDMANMVNGLVVGTGDLSELALGWATYNGDHMSMYAVNGSIPKTLVRHLVEYTANNGKGKFKSVLLDIVDTPVSPELLPSDGTKINQVTEDIVGPYVLHDFFLYNFIKRGFSPKKNYVVAVNTFKEEFDSQTVLKWLRTFIRRFFSQQFKRSCLPDGVKVTEISLSPRNGLNMPSDAMMTLWLSELEDL